MNYKSLMITAALGVGMGMASPALAGPFLIDVDNDFSGNDSTTTGEIRTLGTSDSLATSFYFGDPNVAGTQIVDTNIQSDMDGFGFSSGTFTAVDGSSSVTLSDPNDVGDRNVVNLNPEDGIGGVNFRNGFSAGDWASDGEGWGLTFDYRLEGQVIETADGLSLEYTSGFFDAFFEDGASGDRTQVMRMNVESSDLQAANLDLFGSLDYNGDWDHDSEFVQNFMVDAATGRTFYDIASEEGGSGIPISWRLDTNVDPPLPEADQLVQIDEATFVRQSELNSTVRYEVPEPGMLVLLGTGLLFLGFLATRRRQTLGNDFRA